MLPSTCHQPTTTMRAALGLPLCLTALFCLACEPAPAEDPAQPILQEEIIRYYAIRMEGETAVRDTLKDCFSCNQGTVYDRDGRELELRFYQGDGTDTFGYEVYRYNEAGQKIGSGYYEGDSLTTRYDYELDDQGRILIGRAYNVATGEMLYGYQYGYNDAGLAFETGSMNAAGEVYEYYRRTYNENGIVIAENIEDLDGNPTFRVRYDYRPAADSTWTEQLTYYNDNLSEIRFRERRFFE